jgi:DNA repair exonuclease SbcCD nuclease subunit
MSNLKQFKVEPKYVNYNRIFLLSDTHMGVRANSVEWLENQVDFFENFYIPYLKSNVQRKDILVFLGDFFDSRQAIDVTILNIAINIVEKLAKILPVHILIGNHDCGKKYDTDINSVIAFKHIPNVVIYEKPYIITNKENFILLLPWIGNKEAEENYVRTNKFDYIFAHADISGFKYDNGREIKESNSANLLKFRNIKRLFSGHIHKRQDLNNFIYIGSPYHTKRSDIGNQKGLYLFNPKENSFEFTPNIFSPIFQRVLLEGILELSLQDTIKLLNNNYTDIIVPDKYIHLFNLTKFIDILKDCKYKKIETVAERRKLEDELSDALNGVDIRDILTLLDMSISDLGHPTEVQTKLKQLNKNYYEKAGHENLD